MSDISGDTVMRLVDSHICFGGEQRRYQHPSAVLACDMSFSIYLPPDSNAKTPLIYWLSGLTCTDENFVQKSGAQRYAAEHGVAIVAPDTSPRGASIPDDPEGAYDLGLGAGFYVNASEQPWAENYRMYDYVVDELPQLLSNSFELDSGRVSIMGHSMGGHGALSIALKNPGRYKSVSAFAPIVSPLNCPWGHKALTAYLGSDQSTWRQYDSCDLIAHTSEKLPLLVDQGDADSFLLEQLKPELLQKACNEHDHPLTLRMQPGYDHSYFFIASFMSDHIKWHANALFATG